MGGAENRLRWLLQRRGVGLVPPQSALEDRQVERTARRVMIGMPIFPVRDGNRARLVTPDERDRGADLIGGAGDATVGPAEILTPGGTENTRSRFGFALPLFRRAVAAKLAGREVAEPDRMARGRVAGDNGAESDLDVVWMWSEDQHVKRHLVDYRDYNTSR